MQGLTLAQEPHPAMESSCSDSVQIRAQSTRSKATVPRQAKHSRPEPRPDSYVPSEASLGKLAVRVNKTLHHGKFEIYFIRNSLHDGELFASCLRRASHCGSLHVDRVSPKRIAQLALLGRARHRTKADEYSFATIYNRPAAIPSIDYRARPDHVPNFQFGIERPGKPCRADHLRI